KSVLPSPLKSPTIGVQFALGGEPKFQGVLKLLVENVPSPLLRETTTVVADTNAMSVLPSPLKSPTICVQFAHGGWPGSWPGPVGIAANVPSPLLRKTAGAFPVAKAKSVRPSPLKSPTINVQY